MEIHVIFIGPSDTTKTHIYTCNNRASRQLWGDGRGNLTFFHGDPGVDEEGRRVRSAQYRDVSHIITYAD